MNVLLPFFHYYISFDDILAYLQYAFSDYLSVQNRVTKFAYFYQIFISFCLFLSIYSKYAQSQSYIHTTAHVHEDIQQRFFARKRVYDPQRADWRPIFNGDHFRGKVYFGPSFSGYCFNSTVILPLSKGQTFPNSSSKVSCRFFRVFYFSDIRSSIGHFKNQAQIDTAYVFHELFFIVMKQSFYITLDIEMALNVLILHPAIF